MDWRDYITVDLEACHGRPCIAGAQVPMITVLDNRAVGLDAEAMIQSYPSPTRESVQAAVSYAAERADASPPVAADAIDSAPFASGDSDRTES